MDILFLSHCTPDAPDKGEKIRAYHELTHLARSHRVHLACFARTERELSRRDKLEGICASVYIERLRPATSLPGAAVRAAAGESFVSAVFRSSRMDAYVRRLTAGARLDACLAFSSVMARQAPAELPRIVDMVDVDSEKWRAYAAMRRPGFLFAAEAARLRRLEAGIGGQASCIFVSTAQEAALYREIAAGARARVLENGVDGAYFDPASVDPLPELAGRRYLLFVGAMDYYPNRQAVVSFCRDVFPGLVRQDPGLEFLIAGRNPSRDVRELDRLNRVSVVGGVPDVRPYLRSALAVVAPLAIARGIQNKVLEALAMGKPVLASDPIVRTFGDSLPEGVFPASGAETWVEIIGSLSEKASHDPNRIREAACSRFRWESNLDSLDEELRRAAARRSTPRAAK